MTASSKVTATHLARTASLSVRRSSLRQVAENRESTRRRYALRERATALAWPPDQLTVIDSDLGRSGASTAGREGLQHLVAEVGLGHAGIVLGLSSRGQDGSPAPPLSGERVCHRAPVLPP